MEVENNIASTASSDQTFVRSKKESANLKLPEPVDLPTLIKGINIIFEGDHVNIEALEKYLKQYKSKPSDWKQFAKFDAHKYTRNLVDTGNGKYNLILLCWGEGHGSSIHDHSDAHCFYKMLQGSLTETLFEWPKSKKRRVMVEKESVTVHKDDVGYINDSMGLHRVENKSHTEPAVSLHLYCPPFHCCQSFDQRSGHVTKCKVTFWSKFGLPSCDSCDAENN